MRVGIYARVSTADKHQDPETQLVPLREYVAARGWECVGEFVDRVSAGDLARRTAWTTLLRAASKKQLDCIVVWKLDRAFRSMPHMVSTVQDLRRWGVGLRSYSEPMIDTTDASPMGNLLLNILAAVAEFEKGLISERVRAGMDRARKQGKPTGRPTKLNGDLDALVPDIVAGRVSQRQAARQLGVAVSTVSRTLSRKGRVRGAPLGIGNPDRMSGSA
jgi:DNA invertase Pin-like site-specific DNA recombinase